jgi:hypothetical protein
MHQHREKVPRPHQPAVKERKARQGHEQDKRRSDQHPGGATGVDRRCGGSLCRNESTRTTEKNQRNNSLPRDADHRRPHSRLQMSRQPRPGA